MRSTPTYTLSSRAKSRDLQFNGPVLEMFSTKEGPAVCLRSHLFRIASLTSPNLLPGSIVTNGSQKHVYTHNNNKTNNHKQANSDQKNAEHIHVAACDCQHTGHSLSAAKPLAKHHRRR